MTIEQVNEVLTSYDRVLEAMGVEICEHPLREVCLSEKAALEHARSMIPRMRELIADDQLEKLWRWLGWMQGVLWSFGIYTLDEERGHNRSRS